LIQGITSAIDSRDGVFIGGEHLHHTCKLMTNIAVTLDQFAAIADGGRANDRTERKGPCVNADKVFKFGPFCIEVHADFIDFCILF
jgi:hypothetical protein